eukprot:g10305.t1
MVGGNKEELGARISRRKFDAAEPLYRRALEEREARLGTEHPATLAVVNNLACLLSDMGRIAEAEPLFQRVIEVRCGQNKTGDQTTEKFSQCLRHLVGWEMGYPACGVAQRRNSYKGLLTTDSQVAPGGLGDGVSALWGGTVPEFS